MQITGGKVSFSRSVQPAQYETKKAEVELDFACAEGEDLTVAMLDKVSDMAVTKALAMVGLEPTGTEKATVTTTSVPSAGNGRTKADIEKEAAAALAAKTADKKPVKPPAAAKPDPAAVTGDTPQITKNPENRTDPAVIEDNDPLGIGEVDQPMTDADLIGEIQAHNAKIKNAPAIKKLVAEYAGGPAPKRAQDIPDEKRKEFVAKLKELKPAA